MKQNTRQDKRSSHMYICETVRHVSTVTFFVTFCFAFYYVYLLLFLFFFISFSSFILFYNINVPFLKKE